MDCFLFCRILSMRGDRNIGNVKLYKTLVHNTFEVSLPSVTKTVTTFLIVCLLLFRSCADPSADVLKGGRSMCVSGQIQMPASFQGLNLKEPIVNTELSYESLISYRLVIFIWIDEGAVI